MTRQKNIYKLCLAAMMLLFIACRGGGEVAQEIPEKPTETTVDERGYDPLELPGDKEIVPLAHPRSGDITGRTALVETAPSVADSGAGVIANVPEAADTLNSQAYRIQIFAGKLYGEARHELAIAEEIFDRPVFVDYEVPYFKVRVGNFAEREQAEEYQQRARAAGYTNAWVVMVNIAVKETAPLYEEGLSLEADSLYQVEEPLEEND
ncbi:MAG: SPOR domain-containing protein [candidate division Zixibacteria bacterium]|nr:SPOR domain-containing protein [candidate division Zixibacteria bacterium]